MALNHLIYKNGRNPADTVRYKRLDGRIMRWQRRGGFFKRFLAVLAASVVIPAALIFGLPSYVRAADNILVLHSYHQGLQWTDRISEGILSELKININPVEIHFEYLDTKRNPSEAYFSKLVDFERQKKQLSNINFKVIIASDNNAMRFVMNHGADLFPRSPVVFCGVNNYHPEMHNGRRDVTGVVEYIDYKATLDLMLKLHPDRDRVMVILDRTVSGHAIKKELDIVSELYAGKLEFEYYQDFTLEEVPQHISSLGDRHLIYLLTFNRDRKGQFISYLDGVRMIRQAAKVPIYGSWEFYFGNGIVGGMITSGYTQGRQAGRIAKQILAGQRVDQIPVISQSPNRYMFDFSEMERFGISSAVLPESSIVINQPPNIYIRHIKAIIALLGSALLIVTVLGWRLAVQRRREHRLKSLNLELDRRVALQTQEMAEKNALLENEIVVRQAAENRLLEETRQLETALAQVKRLSGMLPICSSCKKIRDDNGYWNQIEAYIHEHSDAQFSHGICPDCIQKLYPDFTEN